MIVLIIARKWDLSIIFFISFNIIQYRPMRCLILIPAHIPEYKYSGTPVQTILKISFRGLCWPAFLHSLFRIPRRTWFRRVRRRGGRLSLIHISAAGAAQKGGSSQGEADIRIICWMEYRKNCWSRWKKRKNRGSKHLQSWIWNTQIQLWRCFYFT